MNKFSPKKIFLVYITVTLCIDLGCADDFNHQRSDDAEEFSGQNEGRAISLEAASHPAVVAASGLVTLPLALGLLGSGLALARTSSNRRSDYDDPYYYDERQDVVAEGNRQYATNVRAFEDRVFGGAARNALNGMRNMRRTSRRFRDGLRKTARAMGHNTVQGVRAMARGTGQMARSAGKGVHTVARMAGRGLAKVGTVARVGMAGMANSLSRVGFKTRKFGRKLAGVGVAAARGLSLVGNQYRRNVVNARSSLGNGLYYVGDGVSRVGNAASKGFHRFGKAYVRSLRRLGNVQPLGDAWQNSVSRIGELASVSAAKFGGIATDVTDGVSRVAEVASDLPKSLSNVAREKKVQDCFLQAMCYISTPYLSQNEVRRRKRALRSISENGGWETLTDNLNDDETGEHKDLNEERAVGEAYFNDQTHMDDCEVFQCSVASLGRKAYGFVRKFGDR